MPFSEQHFLKQPLLLLLVKKKNKVSLSVSTLYNGLLNNESICYDEVDDLLI